jgi:alkenylglycerophosphocholine hydrolase
MTQIAQVMFAGAIVFALVDWFAVARAYRRLRWVSKPAVILLLVGVALTLHRSSDQERYVFAGALFLCLVGDLALLMDERWFGAGLAAFLVAHLCYAAGFLVGGVNRGLLVYTALAVTITSLGLGGRVLRSILQSGRHGTLLPVAAYLLAISAMLALAAASGKPLAIAGAALFYASDGMIAWNRYVQPLPWSPLPVIVTYHLAQAGLVLSLAS